MCMGKHAWPPQVELISEYVVILVTQCCLIFMRGKIFLATGGIKVWCIFVEKWGKLHQTHTILVFPNCFSQYNRHNNKIKCIQVAVYIVSYCYLLLIQVCWSILYNKPCLSLCIKRIHTNYHKLWARRTHFWRSLRWTPYHTITTDIMQTVLQVHHQCWGFNKLSATFLYHANADLP